MTKYHVAFKRTEWTNFWVEADTPAQAENKAWEQLDREYVWHQNKNSSEWLLDSVEEEELPK